jgi:hypothetical protein
MVAKLEKVSPTSRMAISSDLCAVSPRRYRRRWGRILRAPTARAAATARESAPAPLRDQSCRATPPRSSICAPVRQEQPAFIEFNRRSAIANLNKLPGKFQLHNGLTAVPCVQVVRMNQVQVLLILLCDHGVSAANFTREQRHPFVACR